MNDQKIVQYIQEEKRTKAFVQLYKGFPVVNKLIQSKGGTKEEAEDVFQEALIIFYKKAKEPEFKLTSAISTYLYSVSRFLWKDRQKLKKINVDVGNEATVSDGENIEELLDQEKNYQLVEEVLKTIGEKCLKILQLFYYSGFSMREIARQVDLKSEKVAKNQKYKCLERARKKLSQIQFENI